MLTTASGWSADIDWTQLLLTQVGVVVVALLTSNALAAWARGRAERYGEDKNQAQTDLRHCLDALGQLRKGYRDSTEALKAGQDTPGLNERRDNFFIASNLCLSDTVATAAEEYAHVGDLYFGGDENTSVTQEEEAFRGVTKAVRSANSRFAVRVGRRRVFRRRS